MLEEEPEFDLPGASQFKTAPVVAPKSIAPKPAAPKPVAQPSKATRAPASLFDDDGADPLSWMGTGK